MRIVCHKTHVMTRTPRNVLQPWSFIQKQNQKSPYQTVSHYCRYLPHTNILNRIPRRCPRKLPTNLSLWTATSWRGRICCTAVTQTKSRDWYRRRLFPITVRGLSDVSPTVLFPTQLGNRFPRVIHERSIVFSPLVWDWRNYSWGRGVSWSSVLEHLD